MITVHIIKLHFGLSVRQTVQLSHGRRIDHLLATLPMPTGGRVCFVVFVIFTAFIVVKLKDSMVVSCVILTDTDW